MLWSFALLSLRGLLLLSLGAAPFRLRELNFGMRLDFVRGAEELMLFDNRGRDGAGDPEDRGSETQSSERESNQA